jgi:steroid 5-alpha reductase family enzyme
MESQGMKNQALEAVLAIVIAVAVAAGIGWAGSQGGMSIAGVSAFVLAGVVAFVIQWVVFVPSYISQTERWYDLTGSLTYLTVAVGTLLLVSRFDARSLLLVVLVVIWAGRLGSFLYRRIKETGADTRFDDIKPSFLRFLMAWTLQGLWVFLTLAAALAAITSERALPLGMVAWVGLVIWIAGFAIEAIADAQKQAFRSDAANRGRFIRSGLWAWSRHPNYFGEIMLWVGVALIALPVLSGWQYLTLISPVFVYLLLTRVSGIPMLEARADERWGGNPDYEAYKASTPVLFPRPPGEHGS